MKNNLVSIIIPVYNVEKYVEKCILSALEQDYENVEIIIIDDGSTDGSKEVCRKFVYNPKIKLIEQENSGVSVARNNGIEMSNGEWIIFVDGDDYMEKDMVSKLVDAIKKSDADVIITPPIFEYENETKKGKIFDKEKIFDSNNKTELELNIICRQFGNNYNTDIGAGGPWGKIFKSEFIKKNKLIFVPRTEAYARCYI